MGLMDRLGTAPRAKRLAVAAAAAAIVAMLCLPIIARAGDRDGDTKKLPQEITAGQSAALGVVEGITEYLPVSSTGHLILVSHAMGLSRFSDETGPFGKKLDTAPALEAFEIVIQLGAILAVLGLYRRRVWQMCLGLAGRDAEGLRMVGLLLVAFIPAAVVGLTLRKPIKEHLFGPATVCWALGVGGAAMIVIEYFFHTRRKGKRPGSDLHTMRYWQALVIGLAQCLALWPGTSRSMVTILAAIVVGMNIVAAAEFSFLLALPTLGAATVYEGVKDWDALIHSTGAVGLLIGILVSGLVAALAVKLFVKWLTTHGLYPFGVYRIILAAVVWGYLLR